MNKKINIFVACALLTSLVIDSSDGGRNLPSTEAISCMAQVTGINQRGETVPKAQSPSRLAVFTALTKKNDEERRVRLLQEASLLQADTSTPPRVVGNYTIIDAQLAALHDRGVTAGAVGSMGQDDDSAAAPPLVISSSSISPVDRQGRPTATVRHDSLDDFYALFYQGGGPVTRERFDCHSRKMNQKFSILANAFNGPLYETKDKVVNVIKRLSVLQREQKSQKDAQQRILENQAQILALLQRKDDSGSVGPDAYRPVEPGGSSASASPQRGSTKYYNYRTKSRSPQHGRGGRGGRGGHGNSFNN